MSLPISPLVGPQIPDEIKLKYFSFLSLPEQCKTREVCKGWLALLSNNEIWKPIFKSTQSIR